MADTAFQTVYRDEFIAGYEFRQSMLSTTVVNEAMIKGNQAVFLVADSGGAAAVTRGVNGLIPARPDNLNQYTAVLTEWHDLVRKTGFNIFASQGDQRRIMQESTMAVINRKVDLDIIEMLDTATNAVGVASSQFSVNTIARALTVLGNNFVDITDSNNLFGVCTPAFWAYMMQTPEAANGDWVDNKPFSGPVRKYWRWFGINWIMHPLLTGTGTSTEKCYIYHRNALGHVANQGGIQTPVGYDEEQDYSYARASVYLGSKLLQNNGVVLIRHDGSAYTATA